MIEVCGHRRAKISKTDRRVCTCLRLPDALLEPSQWTIVYDLELKTIVFKSRASNSKKEIHLDQLSFDEDAPERMADMNLKISGNFIPLLKNYTLKANTKLIKKNSLLFAIAGKLNKICKAIAYGDCQAELNKIK